MRFGFQGVYALSTACTFPWRIFHELRKGNTRIAVNQKWRRFNARSGATTTYYAGSVFREDQEQIKIQTYLRDHLWLIVYCLKISIFWSLKVSQFPITSKHPSCYTYWKMWSTKEGQYLCFLWPIVTLMWKRSIYSDRNLWKRMRSIYLEYWNLVLS